MGRLRQLVVVLLATGAFALPGSVPTLRAEAEGAKVIRFASLAPPGSAFMKVMKAWNRSLKKATQNRVELRFYSGGSQGDDTVSSRQRAHDDGRGPRRPECGRATGR